MPGLISILLCVASVGRATQGPWPPAALARAKALVAQMTQAEKLSLLQGESGGFAPYAGSLPAIPRLGIPQMTVLDGPQGAGDGLGLVTAFPTALAAASTWDPQLLQAFGQAMGEEQFGKGVSFMLGPACNLARVPLNGRLYEYLAEEPFLSTSGIVSIVTGVQATNNVSATVKHFLANSQEWDRNNEDANMDERTMREMYMPAYLAAAAAGAGSFMLGVNKIRGLENSANPETMGILVAAGFEGFFMTDWAGIVIANASAAAWAGTSVEMPQGFQYQYLPAFIANGSVPISVINGLVTRVLTPAAALGLLDTLPEPALRNASSPVNTPAHAALARTIATRSAVLLKNEAPEGDALPLLPLTPARLPRGILVLGDQDTVTGCGSGGMVTPYIVTPFQGLMNALATNSTRTINCTVYPNLDFFQDGATCKTVNGSDLNAACCALCTSTPSCNAWTLVPNQVCPNQPMAGLAGQCFLKPNTEGETPHPGITSGTCAPIPTLMPVQIYEGQNASIAAAMAQTVDAVVIVAAIPVAEPDPGCEGMDRLTLALPQWVDDMIWAVVASNPRVVVVTRTHGAALMPWLGSAAAVIHTGLAGQEAGNALADVLVGVANPSGKLTVSFPSTDSSSWLTTPNQYPGLFNITGDGFWQTNYTEGLFVGYRYYDATPAAPAPLFQFGHGLSYSTFTYSNLAVSGSVGASSNATVSFSVSNSFGPAGREVAQLYVAGGLPGDPVRTLKGFAQTGLLAPGATADLSFELTSSSLSFYNSSSAAWQPFPNGPYSLWAGASSKDLRLMGSVTVGA